MADERLRYLDLYAGLVFSSLHSDSLDRLLDNREQKVLGKIGNNFLSKKPVVGPKGAATNMTYTVSALEGISSQRPIYIDGPNDVPLEVADTGILQGNTIVANAGNSRLIVLTAEWVGISHTQRRDYYGNLVTLKVDDGIRYRVFMGPEAVTGTEALPLGDLITQLNLTGAIPILVIRRDFGQTLPDESTTWLWEEYTTLEIDLLTTVKQLTLGMQSNNPGAWFRRIGIGLGNEETDRRANVTSFAAAAGGKVDLSAGEIYLFFIEGLPRKFDTNSTPWESEDLDINSTYLVRAQLNDYGSLIIYITKGTIPSASGQVYDSIPASLKGTSGGLAGAFPTTSKDVLLAIVQTGGVGSVPTVTNLYNGDFAYNVTIPYDHSVSPPAVVELTVPKPFSCDYDISLKLGSGNYNPTPPMASHQVFVPSVADVDFYEWRKVAIKGIGRWLEKFGGDNLLRVPAVKPFARPEIHVQIRPKYRNVS